MKTAAPFSDGEAFEGIFVDRSVNPEYVLSV